jgi:hypothetical protein
LAEERELSVVELAHPTAGGKCEVIDGAPERAAEELVARLADRGALLDAGS